MSNPNRPPPPPSSKPPPPPTEAIKEEVRAVVPELSEDLVLKLAERIGLSLGVALKAQGVGQGSGAVALTKPANKNEGTLGQCADCGQQLVACKGEHIEMVVFPSDQRFARWFHGICIGGVRYRSNGPGHRITVPKSNDIAHMVSLFEREESANAMGREYAHNSGYIGHSAHHYGGMRPVEQSFGHMQRY